LGEGDKSRGEGRGRRTGNRRKRRRMRRRRQSGRRAMDVERHESQSNRIERIPQLSVHNLHLPRQTHHRIPIPGKCT
jgi:hypothetical protein